MIGKFIKKHGLLLLVLLLAFFLRFYSMTELMAFGGDVARDYLVARDITLKGAFPLLGSPTSVPWLHQGALFTYILGLVLWLGRYNPLSGGYFVGAMGVASVLGIYFLGKRLFSEKVGLLAALFYSTSPLTVIFDRYPYHQSLISIFTMAFIFSLYLSMKRAVYFLLSFFLFGLLMQLELSNLVLLPILLIWLFLYRKSVTFKLTILSSFLFLFTWLPKIIYDLKNGFTQTIGLLAWIIHKLPIVSSLVGDKSVNLPFTERITAIFTFLSRIIFWPSTLISTAILIILTFCLIKTSKKFKNNNTNLLLLWIFMPFFGFLVQGSPSESYIPIMFGAVALTVGNGIFYLSEIFNRGLAKKVPVILTVVLVIFNGYTLLDNNYFLKTPEKDLKYSLGFSYAFNKKMADYIIKDAKGEKYNLIALGDFGYFSSTILNTSYLTWFLGNEPSEEKQKLHYLLYDSNEKIIMRKADYIKDFKYVIIAREE